MVEGEGFDFLNQAFRPYVLYLNGEYWGVYFMQEKRNEAFIAQHAGIADPDELNILKATSLVVQGSNTEYKALLDYIESHDMSKQENYDYIAQYIDTDSFMDVMVNQVWIANSDYGNMEFYRIPPDGKWKQIYYDFCWTFNSGSFPNADHPTLAIRRQDKTTASTLFNGLLSYGPWRDAFIKRMAWALEEVYNPDRVIAAIDTMYNLIADEMPAEREKFGGTMANWEGHVDSMARFCPQARRKHRAAVQRRILAFERAACDAQRCDRRGLKDMSRRDDEIFRKLNKEKPLVKRGDISPLSQGDFDPKKSSFDLLVEERARKRAKRDPEGPTLKPPAAKPRKREEKYPNLKKRTVQPKRAAGSEAKTSNREKKETQLKPPMPDSHRAPAPERVKTIEIERPGAGRGKAASKTEPRKRPAAAAQREITIQRPDSRMAGKPRRSRRTQAEPEIFGTAQQPQRPAEKQAARSIEIDPPHVHEKKAAKQQPAARSTKTRTPAPKRDLQAPAVHKTQIDMDAAYQQTQRVPMGRTQMLVQRAMQSEAAGRDGLAYRHELKYYINYADYVVLRSAISALMMPDENAGSDNSYHIRSLYFDDMNESALREKIAGSDTRSKYRIRIYNLSEDQIRFEKKIKKGQYIAKQSLSLGRDEYEDIMAGSFEFLLSRSEPLARDIYMRLKNDLLRPRVLVDYMREAYVYPIENVRVTFDKDLKSSLVVRDIFNTTAPVMPMVEPGLMVLEVKFNRFLPESIKCVLNSVGAVRRSAISKYVICRKFD